MHNSAAHYAHSVIILYVTHSVEMHGVCATLHVCAMVMVDRIYSMTILLLYPTQKLLGVHMAEFRVVLLAHWSKEKGVLKLLQDTKTQDDHKEMSL